MTQRQRKVGYFTLEGLNSFATTFYFYYLFFFMERQFGFGNLGNLSLAALNGLIYIFVTRLAGRLGQRIGYVSALRLGFGIMTVALLAGTFLRSLVGQIAVAATWTIGICFTWPMLEALASEKEDPLGLQRMIGIYNLVWATCSALAYFTGGLLIEKFGARSIFWMPIGVHLLQTGLLWWLQQQPVTTLNTALVRPVPNSIELNPRPIARAKTFLRMAWWANPFAYVAINTVAAVVPGLARKMDLSPRLAGFFCSVWFFARVGTFLALWLWTGWHYRLRWFIGAYLLLTLSFATILLAPKLGIIFLAQISFGFAVGLIYYSSLYYSKE